MSHRTDTSALSRARSFRFATAILLGLAACLFAAPIAQAKFTLKKLHLGSTAGAEDYLYAAGNTVVEQATVDRGRYYRFDVYDPSGAVRLSSACRPAPHNGSVSAGYSIQNNDPLSKATAWRFRLREFASASACSTATSPSHDGSLYFDVAAATSYSDSSLATVQDVFGSTETAYVQVTGAGDVKTSATNAAQNVGSWQTSWILPSGATACANTSNNANDLPGSTADGQLPDRTQLAAPAQPSLHYLPSPTNVDPWNAQPNYETRPCPGFATSNQGQWSLLIRRDSTHFVTLPAFSVNTTPPQTTLISAPSNVTASTTATFQFISSEPGSTFKCSLDNATPTTCTSPQSYTGLANGPHTFSVQATDPAGNVDPTPATASWTVDTVAPSVVLSKPDPGSYTNDTTPTLSGTAESAAGDTAVTVDVYAGTDTSGTPVQADNAAVQPDSSWSVQANVLPEGTYTVQAQQTDGADNTGFSDQHTFTVDTTAPAIAIFSPANGTHTDDDQPDVSGTAGTAPGDLPTVTVTVTGGGSPVTLTPSVSPSGAWEAELPQTLADGNYTIQATQQDLAGNTGTSTSSVTVDTTPPQTFLDAAPVGVTSSTSATFAFHSTDALSQNGTTFQCQLDGGAWGACTSPLTYFNLADGTHTFSVAATDGAGNSDPVGQTVTWTVNSALPAISLNSPSEGSFINVAKASFAGTAGTDAGDGSTVQVLIYVDSNLTGSPVQTLNPTVATDGSWSAQAAALPDGTYAAYARQSSSAGTATSNVHTFTIMTQAPTTTITLGPPGNTGTGSASFDFVSSTPGSTFQCQLDGGGWNACSAPQQYSGLSAGSHTFQVRAIDPAGNVGSPATQTWSVNTSLPALTLSSPADGAASNNPNLTIAGTGGIANGDAGSVTVKIFRGTSTSGTPVQSIATPVASGSGSWSTHPSPGLQDGTYTVYAQQTGSAGTAFTTAITFTIDTTPPTTTITSGAQGTTSATSARFAFTSSEPGSTFQCQLDGPAWTACTSPQSYTSLALGAHNFSVRAIDAAGNVDPNPPVASWTVDTPANVPVTLTAPADGTVTSNTTPTFSGAASASNGDITVEIDDFNGDPVEDLDVPAAASWSVTASPALPDGNYTAFASQLGNDGITTDFSSVIDFTVDTTPPAVTMTSGPAPTANNATPSFGGGAGTAAGDDTSVTVKIYSGTTATGTAVQSVPASVTGSSWTATAATLTDGTYTAIATQSDAAGNTGQTSKRTFTIDTVAPAVTMTSGPAPTANNATPSFGGGAGTAAGDDTSVTVKIYSGTTATGTAVQSVPASVTGSSWTATAATLTDGTYTAIATQSDAAGNTGQSSARTFTIDTVVPNTSITSGPPASTTATSATFSFTSSKAGSTFACKLDTGAWATCTSPMTLQGLAVGDHTFAVRATDALGNVDPTPATASWTITAPSTGTTPGGTTPGGTTPSGTTPSGTMPGGKTPGAGTEATLRLTLKAKAKQRLLRRRPLKVTVSCAQACSLLLSGRVTMAGKRHGHRRARARKLTLQRILATKLVAGQRVTLKLKLNSKTRRAVTAALKGKRRVTLTVSGVASATGMKPGAAHATIRVIR